ncbi:MAG: LytTR family DNA-binding domain-containing protein [Acidobacteriota bacterium]
MSETPKIRVVVADDEPLARERIRKLLRGDEEIEVVKECASGKETVDAIRNLRPDLLFLDVQMPELNGFGVLEKLAKEPLPAIVFVTAYDQYALKAFEYFALDYLLKPFDRDRFQKALQRAKSQILLGKQTDISQGILSLIEELRQKPKSVDRLVVKNAGRVFFVKPQDVDWIEADANYVQLHVGRESHLLRETLTALEAQLDPGSFLRIHRSTIVNIDRIKELQPWFHGEYRVILQDGTALLLGRKYREKLRTLIGKTF